MVLKQFVQEDLHMGVQQAVLQRKQVTLIVEEADGEHTVAGLAVGYRAEGSSLQIQNEWGRFHIPIASIVRFL